MEAESIAPSVSPTVTAGANKLSVLWENVKESEKK